MSVGSIAFIGDVHGMLDPLVTVVKRVRAEADTLVFLGDYVNRGRQSRQVLEFLVRVRHQLGDRAIFLVGHHDEAFLSAIDTDRVDRFLRMGGAATLSSYPRQEGDDAVVPLRQRVPPRHIEFLRDLKRSFTGDGCFAAHDPIEAAALEPGTFGVFGHRLLATAVPEIDAQRALIDTGCGTLPDGRLTCFQWPSKTWFQAF